MRKIVASILLCPVYYFWLKRFLAKGIDFPTDLHWTEKIIYDWGFWGDGNGFWAKRLDNLWCLEFQRIIQRMIDSA